MEYAEYLLSTSRLQVQTIATHCGIIDTQYFSKLFKKYKGVSPIQFRNKNIDKNN
jgi:AraC-like DNA-binding protein